MPRCLNCGSRMAQKDKFCSNCGQPADTARYSLGAVMRQSMSSLTRFDSVLPHTLKLLFTRPWQVVRDTINGRRAGYIAPVKLLVILSFIYIICGEIFGTKVQGNIRLEDTDTENIGVLLSYVMKFIDSSVITQYLILGQWHSSVAGGAIQTTCLTDT